jgi:MFS family permease
MRETYAATILEWKVRRLQKGAGSKQFRSKLDTGTPAWEILSRAIIRPTKLMLLSPINIILSVGSAFVYGLYYLLLTNFPLVYEETYGFSPGISGLAYLGLGIGSVFGLFLFGATNDRYIRSRMAKGQLKPEDRLTHAVVAMPILVVSLFWFGWSAQAHAHWIVPILASTVFGIGASTFFLPLLAYIVDAFAPYAASALAANTVLRSIGGALLPLAGTSMYHKLGFGWSNSLLAFLALVFCPMMFLLCKYGEMIRLRYPLKL